MKFKWEISITELKQDNKTIYKVTRRLPNLSIAETKVFLTKEKALEQLKLWSKSQIQ